MRRSPAISVIIPVFNGSAHIRECLDSVLAQGVDGLEIIIVDDASTDDTPAILEEYSKASGNLVRVLRQSSNQGVSAARNRGTEAARGTYLAYVDSDDILRPDMYQHLIDLAENLDLDVVSCGMQQFNEEGDLLGVIAYPMRESVLYQNSAIRLELQSGFTSKLLWFPVRSLYRRSLVQNHAIRFDTSIKKGEDSLFNLEVLSRAQACGVVKEAYYLYRKHAASVTARPLPSESQNIEALAERVTRFLTEQGFPRMATDDFYQYILSSDLPTALVRLAGHPGSLAEIRKLRSSQHVRAALSYLGWTRPRLPWRTRLLLKLFEYAPSSVVGVVLGARYLSGELLRRPRAEIRGPELRSDSGLARI